jgi:hypothetical protein
MSIAAKIPVVKRMTTRLVKKKLVMMDPTAAAAKRILAVTQLALTAWPCANAK